MSRITKNQKAVTAKYDASKQYTLAQACEMLKDITFTKFDASVEFSANLGVDPRKANQMIRGVVSLPHGTGKVVRFLYSVLLTRRTRPRKPEQTMLVSMNM